MAGFDINYAVDGEGQVPEGGVCLRDHSIRAGAGAVWANQAGVPRCEGGQLIQQPEGQLAQQSVGALRRGVPALERHEGVPGQIPVGDPEARSGVPARRHAVQWGIVDRGCFDGIEEKKTRCFFYFFMKDHEIYY